MLPEVRGKARSGTPIVFLAPAAPAEERLHFDAQERQLRKVTDGQGCSHAQPSRLSRRGRVETMGLLLDSPPRGRIRVDLLDQTARGTP